MSLLILILRSGMHYIAKIKASTHFWIHISSMYLVMDKIAHISSESKSFDLQFFCRNKFSLYGNLDW